MAPLEDDGARETTPVLRDRVQTIAPMHGHYDDEIWAGTRLLRWLLRRKAPTLFHRQLAVHLYLADPQSRSAMT
jgi:hypothetical protein